MNAEKLTITANNFLARATGVVTNRSVKLLSVLLAEFEQTIRQQVAEECDRFDPVCKKCGEALTSYELVCDECREIGRK